MVLLEYSNYGFRFNIDISSGAGSMVYYLVITLRAGHRQMLMQTDTQKMPSHNLHQISLLDNNIYNIFTENTIQIFMIH